MCEEAALSFVTLLAYLLVCSVCARRFFCLLWLCLHACLLACLVCAENADLMRRKESTVTARPAMDTDRPMMVMMLRASWCSWGRAD